MADPDRIARIRAMRAYIEQHRDTTDREALRQHLLAEGHDPETIDIALYHVYGPSWQFVVILIGTVVLIMLVLFVLFALFYGDRLPPDAALLPIRKYHPVAT